MPIDWLTWGAAAFAGLMGGVHCVAMCGGIATGFSAMGKQPGWLSALQPNLGRIVGYTVAGGFAGAVGNGVIALARNETLAMGLRMTVGLVLIVAALRLLGFKSRLGFLPNVGSGFWRLLQPLQRRLLPANTAPRRFALGLLWGWMPCGLSTTVLMAAWLQADALNGAGTMAAFGLGTLPLMLPLTWSGAHLGQRLRRGHWRLASAGLILSAGLLTVVSPWLMGSPILNSVLTALGCGPIVHGGRFL